MGTTRLLIQLVGADPATFEHAACDVHHGGPQTLLRWLETQLGLLSNPVPLTSRIAQYAAAMDRAGKLSVAASLATDRWATAAEMLARRDELRLEGWVASQTESFGWVLADLARIEPFVPELVDVAARLQRVQSALESGQSLPPHECVLFDPLERWPKAWRSVLKHVQTKPAEAPQLSAQPSTALAAAQQQVLDGQCERITTDDSLVWVRGRSTMAACETLVAALGREPQQLARTVICCADPTAALMLDGAVARAGLATMGAWIQTLAHPVLQVLPLALRLCWAPVDPGVLLDFLSLPAGPIPRAAASKLAQALAEQPGLGSHSWNQALQEVCSKEADPEGKVAERLREWLQMSRPAWGSPLAATTVQQVCGRVAKWQMGRAKQAEKTNPELAHAWRLAAGQASAVGELAASQGGDLSEPQIGRILHAATHMGIETSPHLCASGGPRLVTSLAHIMEPCDRLVWLGLAAQDLHPSRWTRLERDQLKRAGVDLDDGTRHLAATRAAERAGLSRVRHQLIAVGLPSDDQQRAHPLWLQVQAAFEEAGVKKPQVLDDALQSQALPPALKAPTQETKIVPPQGKRAQWQVEQGLLRDRDKSSASELQLRLACPFAWVLRYAARVRPSPIARLPDDFLLKGSFCHSVLAAAFGDGGPLPPVDQAVARVGKIFDERIGTDAAPLAQPARVAERIKLRAELLRATECLIKALHAGGYRIKAMEERVTGTFNNRQLDGAIDCLAEDRAGNEAIIDFKYGGSKKYRELLTQGRAVQLATYAYARSSANGRPVGAVAYLILGDALLLTPSGSALAANEPAVEEGPSIAKVWDDFATALNRADDWLHGTVVPARALQPSDEWPPGTDLVLDASRQNPPEKQSACAYCDYSLLCGLEVAQ